MSNNDDRIRKHEIARLLNMTEGTQVEIRLLTDSISDVAQTSMTPTTRHNHLVAALQEAERANNALIRTRNQLLKAAEIDRELAASGSH